MAQKLPLQTTALFIDNEWIADDQNTSAKTINPSDETIITEFTIATQNNVDQAVAAAQNALNGKWQSYGPTKRAELLDQIYLEIVNQVDDFAYLETLDTGKPLQQCRLEILGAAQYFKFYAGAIDKYYGKTIPIDGHFLDFTLIEPIGVTAHITPWNMPLAMIARSLAPALAMGNTAIIKPAEQTPLTALKFAELVLKLNMPNGVVNIINGYGFDTGAYLTSHAGIDSITFTGSVATGRKIMQAAAKHIKPIVLELGGKSPLVIFEDFDTKKAAQIAAKAIYSNTGQYCDAGSRVIIDKKIKESFLEQMINLSQNIKIDIGLNSPDIGPLISDVQHQKVLSFIEQGQESGAQLIFGGKRPDYLDKGYFVEPTIFDQVKNDMPIAQEEIFGPVLSVIEFEEAEEALKIANETPYGLASAILTKNIDYALHFAQKIKAGYVMINEYHIGTKAAPFGGYKQSGIGRESGLETLANYTQIKNVVIHIDQGLSD